MIVFFSFLSLPPPPPSPLFPYTTLFRSPGAPLVPALLAVVVGRQDGDVRTELAHPTSPSCRPTTTARSEEHTSELQSPDHIVWRLLLEKKKQPLTSTSTRTAVSYYLPLS